MKNVRQNERGDGILNIADIRNIPVPIFKLLKNYMFRPCKVKGHCLFSSTKLLVVVLSPLVNEINHMNWQGQYIFSMSLKSCLILFSVNWAPCWCTP